MTKPNVYKKCLVLLIQSYDNLAILLQLLDIWNIQYHSQYLFHFIVLIDPSFNDRVILFLTHFIAFKDFVASDWVVNCKISWLIVYCTHSFIFQMSLLNICVWALCEIFSFSLIMPWISERLNCKRFYHQINSSCRPHLILVIFKLINLMQTILE